MHVRMAHWNCRPEFWGEDRKLFSEGAVPIMQRHEGFRQAMLLAPEGSDQRIAFTVWSDKQAYLQFADSQDLQRITAMFAHMYCDGKRPSPMDFDVRAHSDASSGH